MKIADFHQKWLCFTTHDRPLKISPTYFPDLASVPNEQVVLKFPSKARGAFPLSDGADDAMTPQALGNWLKKETLPKAREKSFVALTGLDLTTWALPYLDFEVAVRRAAGEAASWADLLSRAQLGCIEVQVEDPEPASRFVVAGTPASGPAPTPAWAGCKAFVALPDLNIGPDDTQWQAWLIADYGAEIFALDPLAAEGGAPGSSRLKRSTRTLPRWGALTITPDFAPGRTFNTVVLAFNLEDQPDPVRTLFHQLERRLVIPPASTADEAAHRRVRDALDEVATQLADHDVEHHVWRQPCLVVPAPRRS